MRAPLWLVGGVTAIALTGGQASPDAPALGAPIARATLSQGFGCTSFPLEPPAPACPGGHFHSGVDLAAPTGTPVRAAAAGSVTVIDDSGGYGLHVLLSHGPGLLSLYGHLESVEVATGDRIEAGRVVGRVGSTGFSSGPHLHFEVRRDGQAVDPLPLLKSGGRA